MCFHVIHYFSPCHSSKAALLVATLLLVGCSSNTMRFADGLFTNSTSSNQVENRQMPQQPIPIAPATGTQSQIIEARELPPVEQDTPLPQPEQVAGIGAPPRNLGTLKASDVTLPIVNEANKSVTNRYIVQSGDTLTRIAHKKGVTVAQLRQANALKSDTIRIGQALIMPASAAQTVAAAKHDADATVHQASVTTSSLEANRHGETTLAKSDPTAQKSAPSTQLKPTIVATVKTSATDEKKPEAEQVAILAPGASSTAALRWPAKGRIVSSFGQREGTITNDGIDIMVPEGTPVKAAENGVVIYAGDGLKEFGNTILIRHENNIVTVYGHNGQLLVQRGQKVRRGDEIAKSGKSGNTTTPKLHFEVRENSTPVNPMKYLES